MKNLICINEQFVVGQDQPQAGDLPELARRGIRAVINLRMTGEAGETMSPAKEGEQVRAAGMDYAHVPVAGGVINHDNFDRFRIEAALLPGPIFVHCASGKRAGTFAVMAASMEEGALGENAIDEARGMGLECDAPAMQSFLQDYLDTNGL